MGNSSNSRRITRKKDSSTPVTDGSRTSNRSSGIRSLTFGVSSMVMSSLADDQVCFDGGTTGPLGEILGISVDAAIDRVPLDRLSAGFDDQLLDVIDRQAFGG